MCRHMCHTHRGERKDTQRQFSAPQEQRKDCGGIWASAAPPVNKLEDKISFCADKLRESWPRAEYWILKKCVDRLCRQPCKTHSGETTCINGQISAPQHEFGDLPTHMATLGGKIPFCADKLRGSCPSAEYWILPTFVNRMCSQPYKVHSGEATCINGQITAPPSEFGEFPTHIATLGAKIPLCADKLRGSCPSAEYWILPTFVNRMCTQLCKIHSGETTCINGQISYPQIEFGGFAAHIWPLLVVKCHSVQINYGDRAQVLSIIFDQHSLTGCVDNHAKYTLAKQHVSMVKSLLHRSNLATLPPIYGHSWW
jgi:hypothetical protein